MQRTFHDSCRPEPRIGIIGAGAEHQICQIAGRIGRRRQRLTLQTAVQRIGTRLCIGRLLFCFKEWQAVIVQQPVKHDAQRVNIHPAVIVGTAGHFRCHIIVGAFDGLAALGRRQLACNTKVAQLEKAEIIDEDVLGFDVPVDDGLLFTDLQCRAKVDTQPDDLILRQHPRALPLVERFEQLHPNINIPADLPLALHNFIVFDADDVLDALQRLHQLDLVNKVVHDALQIGAGTVCRHSVKLKRLDLVRVFRDRDHLDRRTAGQIVVCPHYLIDRSVSTAADPPLYFPFGPNFFDFLCHVDVILLS